MSDSLKKCPGCNGTGDKLKRATVLPSLKQQCAPCRGEGMLLDISRWEKILEEGGALQLQVNRNVLDVTPSIEPDLDWKQMDKEDHMHRWRKGSKKEAPIVTTLKWIVEGEATDEYPESGYFECKRCGDRIEPGYKPVQVRREAYGLVEHTINGEEVGTRTFQAVIELVEKGA